MATPETTRPTPLAERTLFSALIVLCALSLVLGGAILFGHWPDAVASSRIHYLGWALLLAVVGILILVISFASPWLGSVRISGLGAQIAVTGEDVSAQIPPDPIEHHDDHGDRP